MGWRAALIATGSALLFASRARAEGRLEWSRAPGAESCASEDELRRRVITIVGRDPFIDAVGPHVSGRVRKDGDTWIATIALDEAGEAARSRGFQSTDSTCGALSEAVALAIALSVEGTAGPASPMFLEVPQPAAPPLPDVAPALRESSRHAWSAQAQALWTLGLLPHATTGLGVAIRYRLSDRVAAAVGGMWLPPASESGRFSVGLTAAKLGVCAETLRWTSVALVNCVHGLTGIANVKGEASTVSASGAHAWGAASVSAALSAKLGERWGFEAGTEGAMPVSRPIYQTNDCPLVGFQQPLATLGVFLSVGGTFL